MQQLHSIVAMLVPASTSDIGIIVISVESYCGKAKTALFLSYFTSSQRLTLFEYIATHVASQLHGPSKVKPVHVNPAQVSAPYLQGPLHRTTRPPYDTQGFLKSSTFFFLFSPPLSVVHCLLFVELQKSKTAITVFATVFSVSRFQRFVQLIMT